MGHLSRDFRPCWARTGVGHDREVFIHDFVHIDMALDRVLVDPGELERWLSKHINPAWTVDLDDWTGAGLLARDLTPPLSVPVMLGDIRSREDAVVIPVTWDGQARLVPAVQADLELAQCGPRRCDLQLMGRYELNADIGRLSREASLAHRVTVNAVRRLLEELADALVASSSPLLTPAPARPS